MKTRTFFMVGIPVKCADVPCEVPVKAIKGAKRCNVFNKPYGLTVTYERIENDHH